MRPQDVCPTQTVSWTRAQCECSGATGRSRKSLTKGACNATSEGSDNPISAYRPIYMNGRQTIQFANKKT